MLYFQVTHFSDIHVQTPGSGYKRVDCNVKKWSGEILVLCCCCAATYSNILEQEKLRKISRPMVLES